MKTPQSIETLKVYAFKNGSRQGDCKTFEFMINPDTLNSHHSNNFENYIGISTSGRKSDYAYSNSDQMTLQLSLDDTLSNYFVGNNLPELNNGVKGEVDEFLKYCFYMDGDIHEPRFLKLEWGEISFECRLQSVNVSYTLFNAEGHPLRAKLATVFVADMPDSKRIRMENKKSPDVTHNRMILQGQTLTGLTKEIYGDTSNYLTVANANGLDHFRKLTPGTQLQFPPLDE